MPREKRRGVGLYGLLAFGLKPQRKIDDETGDIDIITIQPTPKQIQKLNGEAKNLSNGIRYRPYLRAGLR